MLFIELSFIQLLKNPDLSLLAILQEYMSDYFNNSQPTALSELLNNRSLAFKINKESSGFSSIIVNTNISNTISYKKITLNINDLKQVFKNLIIKSNEFLIKELLLDINPGLYQDITLNQFVLFEDLNNTDPYKCFRDFNPKVNKTNFFLYNEIINNSILRNQFFDFNNNKLELNKLKVKQYLTKIEQFLKYLLLLIYCTSGLPLRGTELITLRYLNSIKDKREIFLDKGSSLFIINISYYKGYQISEKKASNIRYLPQVVSQMFLLYIVLVTPFIDFLNINSNTSINVSLNSYLFYINKRILKSEDLSRFMASFTNLTIGQKINIQSYRQLIVGFIRNFMNIELDENNLLVNKNSSNSNKIQASQMNHSINTEELHYGRSSLSFSNIKANSQLEYYNFCLRYFEFFELDTIDLNISSFINLLKQREVVNNSSKLSNNTELALRYNSKKHSRQQSSISNSLNKEVVIKKVRTKDLISISSLTSSNIILLDLLKEFLNNPLAQFRIEEQELLLKAILLKVPYILGILPTSSGKSLTYLLTCSLNISKITIVIVPLVGLKNDLIKRAKEFNIPCSIYEDNYKFNNLTLISIESIITSNFIFDLLKLINEDKIDRIIFDECHLLITAASYRPIMYKFHEILKYPIQFVFLTGTLPIDLENNIKSNLFLSDLTTIRANYSRDNIFY